MGRAVTSIKASFFSSLAFLVLILAFLFVTFARAEEGQPEAKRSGWIFLPVIFYTPETGWALGGGGIAYFRLSKEEKARPTNLSGIFIYTQKKQFEVELNPDFYFHGEKTHLQSWLKYSNYPDKFYGIGNDTSEEAEEDYISRGLKFRLEALRKVWRNLNLGFYYNLEDISITETEEGGQLETGEVPGSSGGLVSGLGPLLTWDSRNNIFFATSGSFHQFSAVFYGPGLGSDFGFNRIFGDFRKYISLFGNHSLALQTQMIFESGHPPFTMMAQLGGEKIMRGYYKGRYRDKNMICLQAEYRIVPLIWRFGLVGFVGVGEVADKISNFSLDKLKFSAGFGLRFIFIRSEGLNARLDFGFGEGTSGIYLTVNEAF